MTSLTLLNLLLIFEVYIMTKFILASRGRKNFIAIV